MTHTKSDLTPGKIQKKKNLHIKCYFIYYGYLNALLGFQHFMEQFKLVMRQLSRLKIIASLRDTGHLALLAGTQGYSPDVQRRLRILNMVAYLIIIANLCYVVQYSLIDFHTYKSLIYFNLLSTSFAIFVPFAHRLHETAGALLLVVIEYLALFIFTAYLGRSSGVQLQYFVGAAAPFFFFGIKRSFLPFTVVALGLILHIVCWFSFPPLSAIITADKTMLNSLYVIAAITTAGLISVTVFYAYLLVEEAQERANFLLRNILPGKIADRLTENPNQPIADYFDSASVLFLDLVSFTPLAMKYGPLHTVKILNHIVTDLDALAALEGVEKIKTIGDAYMAVSGVPESKPDHMERLARMALKIHETVRDAAQQEGIAIDVRIGMASGPVLAGIIGTHKFSYDVWGNTVNLASRMESHGEPGRIQVSNEIKTALSGHFTFEDAGINDIKGFGALQTWYLTGIKSLG